MSEQTHTPKGLGFNDDNMKSLVSLLTSDKMLTEVKTKTYDNKRQVVESLYDYIQDLIGKGVTIAKIANELSNFDIGGGKQFTIDEKTLRNYIYRIRSDRKKEELKKQQEERERMREERRKTSPGTYRTDGGVWIKTPGDDDSRKSVSANGAVIAWDKDKYLGWYIPAHKLPNWQEFVMWLPKGWQPSAPEEPSVEQPTQPEKSEQDNRPDVTNKPDDQDNKKRSRKTTDKPVETVDQDQVMKETEETTITDEPDHQEKGIPSERPVPGKMRADGGVWLDIPFKPDGERKQIKGMGIKCEYENKKFVGWFLPAQLIPTLWETCVKENWLPTDWQPPS